MFGMMGQEAGDHCINRNIVECKAARPTFVFVQPCFVLIETLWNVKLHLRSDSEGAGAY